jgi:hypothetical protein
MQITIIIRTDQEQKPEKSLLLIYSKKLDVWIKEDTITSSTQNTYSINSH